ncbi:MAG: hypothetical protein M3P34_00010 [Actinomycetota bacterium]|nr:hypothetical protein [Actinomycetota bacterium]
MAEDPGAPNATVREYPAGYSRAFWPALAVGLVIMAVGVRGLLVNAESRMATKPVGWLVLFVSGNLVHDFVLVPVVLVVGTLVSRLPLGTAIRRPLQFALFCSAVVVLFAYPFARGYGRNPTNPSALPQDYAQGTAVVLALVWGVAILWSLWLHQRRKRAV